MVRAKQPQRLPLVLTRPEVEVLLAALDGVCWIVAMLLYGSVLGLMECLRLSVEGIEFTRHPMLVREGRGDEACTKIARAGTALAVQRRVSASTQNQALATLPFLYRQVLGSDPGWLEGIVRAKRPQRLPVVLSRQEVSALLAARDGGGLDHGDASLRRRAAPARMPGMC